MCDIFLWFMLILAPEESESSHSSIPLRTLKLSSSYVGKPQDSSAQNSICEEPCIELAPETKCSNSVVQILQAQSRECESYTDLQPKILNVSEYQRQEISALSDGRKVCRRECCYFQSEEPCKHSSVLYACQTTPCLLWCRNKRATVAGKHAGPKFLTYLRAGTVTGISEHMGWQMPLDRDLGVLQKLLWSREKEVFVKQIYTHRAWKSLHWVSEQPGDTAFTWFVRWGLT